MSETNAMPLDLLDEVNYGNGQPLCPGCIGGRLHPYKVEFGTGYIPGRGWQGVDYLSGFVAVCVGNASYLAMLAKEYARLGEEFEPDPEVPACGFSMPLTAGRR